MQYNRPRIDLSPLHLFIVIFSLHFICLFILTAHPNLIEEARSVCILSLHLSSMHLFSLYINDGISHIIADYSKTACIISRGLSLNNLDLWPINDCLFIQCSY